MKILQLIYSLCSGGAERFVVNLCNELAAGGNDVTVCMLLSADNSKYMFNHKFLRKEVKFISLDFTPGFTLGKVVEVERCINALNPTVVHCHLNVIPYIYRLACKRIDIKFIHTIHSVAEYASGYRMQKNINRWFYRHNKIVPVTISQKCYESYQAYYRLDNARCIPNGCSCPVKSDVYSDVYDEIISYKTTDKTVVFIHVARYHALKNQMLLVEAFNKLSQLNKDFVLIIVGDGYKDEGKFLVDIACDKIHFVGLKNNVVDYLLCADAFCLTSTHEGLPISLLEAMSCGVVPICTKAGGIPDVITDGETGWLVDDFTVESYAKKLLEYMETPNSIDRLALINLFERSYSMKACANEYVSIYSQHVEK